LMILKESDNLCNNQCDYLLLRLKGDIFSAVDLDIVSLWLLFEEKWEPELSPCKPSCKPYVHCIELKIHLLPRASLLTMQEHDRQCSIQLMGFGLQKLKIRLINIRKSK
jgi:hypothetical protein